MNILNTAATAQQPQSRLQIELQRALGFGQTDLAANREGRITRRQAVRLLFRDAGLWLGFLFLALLSVGSLIIALFQPIILFRAGVSAQNAFALLGGMVIFLGLALFFGWGALYYLRRARTGLAEVQAGVVSSCEGPMSVIEERVQMARGYSYVHFLLAGGERYSVTSSIYRVLENGANYRAFFVPESKVVVAIEAMGQRRENGLRHRDRPYPREMRLGQLVLLPVLVVISGAILVGGLLLENLPAAVLGLGTLLLSGFLIRALVRRW